jgi:hypothetical protein
VDTQWIHRSKKEGWIVMMLRILLALSTTLFLTSCGESPAEKEWKRCSYEVAKMPFDSDKQLEAQAYCNSAYESAVESSY